MLLSVSRLLSVALVAAVGSPCAAGYAPSTTTPPPVPREFRGVWVATVDNINWPPREGRSTASQKASLLAILDRAAELKLNAVIFQVRPACDALYDSPLEPWSEYLTGEQGRAPSPAWDPLAFAVTEAHGRGLELHAWLNPYRAKHPSARSPQSSTHVSRSKPSIVRAYGKSLWLDPGDPQTQEHSLAVVRDIVRRYDVDGVHFDDYFYPYREKGTDGAALDFPDDATWSRFGAASGLSRDDWRRRNVDTFLQRTYAAIKQDKPWVKFGISPFGIWRPGNPAPIRGLDAYDDLYADSRKWLVNGWCDYFTPQLYWAIEPAEQSFTALNTWWHAQNPKHRFVWPGLAISNVGKKWKPQEIVNQIAFTRRGNPAPGHVLWSFGGIKSATNSLSRALSTGPYQSPAAVPAVAWLGNDHLPKPALFVGVSGGTSRATWSLPAGAAAPRQWVLQFRTGGTWRTQILPGSATGIGLGTAKPGHIAVRALDRYGNASPAAVIERKE